jgi:glyceraldehyde-3-phosphate dehydrogenase (NADP+)
MSSGNCVVMKLPRVGVLCHFPTLELFRDSFPPGVVCVISSQFVLYLPLFSYEAYLNKVGIIAGSGRDTMPPIMATGKIDCFAFIGTSQAADALQKGHPKPHRLRVCLGLEAKSTSSLLASSFFSFHLSFFVSCFSLPLPLSLLTLR